MVYSGSIDRIDFGEEEDAKGVCVVTITGPESPGCATADREADYRFVPTPARPFKTLDVSIVQGRDPTEALVGEIGKHDLDEAVVRLTYRTGAAHIDTIDLKAVRAALDGSFFVAGILLLGVVWVTVRKARAARRPSA